ILTPLFLLIVFSRFWLYLNCFQDFAFQKLIVFSLYSIAHWHWLTVGSRPLTVESLRIIHQFFHLIRQSIVWLQLIPLLLRCASLKLHQYCLLVFGYLHFY